MPGVDVISPEGDHGTLPSENLQDGLTRGFKLAVRVTSPEGDAGWLPMDKAHEAVGRGFKIGQPSANAFADRGQNAEGGFSALGSDLAGMVKGAASNPAAMLGATGPIALGQQLVGAGDAYRERLKAGRAPAYAAAAGANEAIGVNAKGMEQSADQGSMSGVLGHAAAVPTAMAATAGIVRGAPMLANAIKPVAGGAAEGLYRSALKPSTTIPLEKSARIIQTGLDSKIPISPEGLEKLNALQAELNKTISDKVSSDPMAFINKGKVAQRLKGTYQDFSQQVNPTPDINRIKKVGYDFMQNNPDQIPATKAQAMKQGTYQSIKSAAYGEMKTATVEAQKALARGIKEELEVQFPEIKKLNSQEGKYIELDSVLERAVNRIGNHQMVGLGTPAATVGGYAVGGSAGAGAAGLLKFVVDNPAVKSKLAIALNSVSKGKMGLPGAHARIAGYSSALGAAASSGRESDGQSTQ